MSDFIRKIKVEGILTGMILVYMLAKLFGVNDIGVAMISIPGIIGIKSSSWLLLTIPFGMVSVYNCIWKKYSLDNLLLVIIFAGICAVGLAGVLSHIGSDIYNSREGTYIYKVFTQMKSARMMFGRGMSAEEVKRIVPECNASLMLSNIMVQYGIIAGILLVVLMFAVCVFLIYRGVKLQGAERVFVTGCGAVLFGMLFINLLINMQVIPFIPFLTFMPFVSGKMGDVFISVLLLVMPLGVIIQNMNRRK